MIIFHSKHGCVRSGFAPLLLGLTVANWPQLSLAQAVRSHEEAARVLVIDKLTYTWLWDNEFKPGKDDPGMGVYHVVPTEIPAGGTAPFKYAYSTPTQARGRPLRDVGCNRRIYGSYPAGQVIQSARPWINPASN